MMNFYNRPAEDLIDDPDEDIAVAVIPGATLEEDEETDIIEGAVAKIPGEPVEGGKKDSYDEREVLQELEKEYEETFKVDELVALEPEEEEV